MRMLLVRHGNTFNANDEVVWVGGRTDMPLTEKGEAQAAELGKQLNKLGVAATRIIASPLKRTTRHAEIIASVISFPKKLEIDERLKEIDYGLWEGKTSDFVEKHYGPEVLKNWSEKGLQPEGAGWSPSTETITENVKSLAIELAQNCSQNDTVVIVTSNGILRHFLNLIPGELDRQIKANNHKVKTGSVSSVSFKNGNWELNFWNYSPSEIQQY